jgi:hypothetical protein
MTPTFGSAGSSGLISVFVSADMGSDVPGCGLNESAPCQTISRALEESPTEILLLAGSYNASEVVLSQVSKPARQALCLARMFVCLQTQLAREFCQLRRATPILTPAVLLPRLLSSLQAEAANTAPDGSGNFLYVGGVAASVSDVVMRCKAGQEVPPPGGTSSEASGFLFVGTSSELALANVT